MNKVARFEANDGKEFKTEKDCAQHEKTILFREWHGKHALYDSDFSVQSVMADQMIEWLQKHRLQVIELLKSNGKA